MSLKALVRKDHERRWEIVAINLRETIVLISVLKKMMPFPSSSACWPSDS